MDKESTLSRIKWIGVSAIISSISTFISTSLINYLYKTSMTLTENSNISLYSIPIVLGIAGSIFLTSYYIFNKGIEMMRMRNGGFSQPILHNLTII